VTLSLLVMPRFRALSAATGKPRRETAR
jgi:hypothetical protein